MAEIVWIIITIVMALFNIAVLYSHLQQREEIETLKAVNDSYRKNIDKLIVQYERVDKANDLILREYKVFSEVLQDIPKTNEWLLKNDTELFGKVRELERLYHQIKFDMEDDHR